MNADPFLFLRGRFRRLEIAGYQISWRFDDG